MRCFSLLLVLFLSSQVLAGTYNGILFSWDGALRKDVVRLMDDGKLPSIKALKEKGVFVELTIKGHDTETGPGHAQMLTGLEPAKSNVYDNNLYDTIPEGATLGERLETFLGKDAIFTVMVMGKEGYMGAKKKGQPYNNAKKNIDIWNGDQGKRPAVVITKAALSYLEENASKRFFMFLHFPDPDSKGHAIGHGTAEYENALIECDKQVGAVIEKLKALNLLEKTSIYVTADHGFDEGKKTHYKAPDIFLVTNDTEVKKGGVQADVTPTILKAFGVVLEKLEPALDGAPLN